MGRYEPVVLEVCPFCEEELGPRYAAGLWKHLTGSAECRRRGREILEQRMAERGRPVVQR